MDSFQNCEEAQEPTERCARMSQLFSRELLQYEEEMTVVCLHYVCCNTLRLSVLQSFYYLCQLEFPKREFMIEINAHQDT